MFARLNCTAQEKKLEKQFYNLKPWSEERFPEMIILKKIPYPDVRAAALALQNHSLCFIWNFL